MKLRTIALFLGLTLTLRNAWAVELVVIDLHNRTAQDLLPVLKPVAGNASLSGVDYKLIVRGDAADVVRIRELLVALDRAPEQLLISVKYSAGAVNRESNERAGGTLTKNGVAVNIDAGQSIRTASDSSVSTVRVLEGNGAHISSGASVPVVSGILLSSTNHKNHSTAATGTEYREVSSGFDVVPRVSGDRVVLEISSQQQRLDTQNAGSVTTQLAATTVSGKIGEWIELGAVSDSRNERQNGVTLVGGAHHIATQSDQRTIAVKVEKGP